MLGYLLFVILFHGSFAIESNFIISKLDVDYVAVARNLVHKSNWAAVATISTEGLPMINAVSTSDSKVGAASTGNIYFCLVNGDISTSDLARESKITFLFSEAQTGECTRRGTAPCGRNCSRASLSGLVRKLHEGSQEYVDGYEAFVSRHPNIPCKIGTGANEYNLYTLDINTILVLSGLGGYNYVSLKEYFAYSDADDAI